MQSRDFIINCIPYLNDGGAPERRCSSILFYNGVVYSYGTHYPLLFAVECNGEKYLFVNTQGYSVTTAKHINWALSACYRTGRKVYGVNLKNTSAGYGYCADRPTLKNVIESLAQEYVEAQKRLGKLTSRAFRLRETLARTCADDRQLLEMLGAFDSTKNIASMVAAA